MSRRDTLARHASRSVRTYTHYSPGQQYGNLTLVRRFAPESSDRNDKRKWWAVCACGRACRIDTQSIANHTPLGQMCRVCAAQTPRRKPGDLQHPPDPSQTVYGRLTVQDWKAVIGWQCRCAVCDGVMWVRTAKQLGVLGAGQCQGMCGIGGTQGI